MFSPGDPCETRTIRLADDVQISECAFAWLEGKLVAVPMSVLKSTALLAIAALVGSTSITLAQKAPAAHSRAELGIYASVLNDRGSPVTSLGPADFVVREEGVEREVTQVSPASEPMRIAVLADTSQSMERNINDLRGALRSFFKEMNGNADIALFEFGDRPARLVDYTRDPALLEAGIGRLFARRGGGAYALDAIVEASRDSRVRESARPVIVVISGQGPEFSQRLHQDVLKELRASHATLHSIVVTRRRPSILRDGARERELTFSEGTRLTGGRREDLLTSMSLGDTLGGLARELKTQYRLVYVRPGVLVPPDRIDVAVRQPRLTVCASRVPSIPDRLP
jgi:VWFA-related protein